MEVDRQHFENNSYLHEITCEIIIIQNKTKNDNK